MNQYGPRIVTDGLTMHLDASNIKSYSGTGTTVYDIAGIYNHNLSGSIFTTVDNVKCFNCTGTGRLQDAGVTFSLGSNHTFIAWARALSNAGSSTWRTLWRTLDHDHPLLIHPGSVPADGTIGYYDNNNGGAFVSFGVNLATLGLENKWTMFTVCGNNGGSFLYINDQYVGYANRNAAGMSQDAIGSTNVGNQPFGYVATATIYKDRSLLIDEIQQNYNALKGRFGL